MLLLHLLSVAAVAILVVPTAGATAKFSAIITFVFIKMIQKLISADSRQTAARRSHVPRTQLEPETEEFHILSITTLHSVF